MSRVIALFVAGEGIGDVSAKKIIAKQPAGKK